MEGEDTMRVQVGPRMLDDGSASHLLIALVTLLTRLLGVTRPLGAWPRLTAPPTPHVPPVMFAKGRSEDSGQRGPGGSARRGSPGAPKRGMAASPNAPTPPPSFKDLSPRQRGVVIGVTALATVAIVGAALLFVNNVNVVRADAADKQGQAYEQVGSQCLSQPQACPIGGAQQLSPQQVIVYTGTSILPQAITYYQQALDEQPSQDRYDLDMGRAQLEEATYYLIVSRTQAVAQQAHLTVAAAQRDATGAFQTDETTLRRARALNPYNADHPMNLARMYTTWAEQLDPSKWPLADTYYRIATGPTLAAHNGRFSDEWGRADLAQAQQPTLTPGRRMVLYQQALAAFQHACAVDDLLGDARIYRGDAEEQLAQLPQNASRKAALLAQARDSYAEALKVGGFEPSTTGFSAQTAVQRLVQADAALNDYKALVRPIQVQDPTSGALFAEVPIALADALLPSGPALSGTLAYSATSPFSLTTTPFTPTLQAISQTLRAKGLVK